MGGSQDRLEIAQDPIPWVARTLKELPLREAPLTFEIAIRSRRVPLTHDDPADRFLAATADVLGLTLVTSDRRLLDCSDLSTLAA